jgi:hypothetical protein
MLNTLNKIFKIRIRLVRKIDETYWAMPGDMDTSQDKKSYFVEFYLKD